jgi:hypothetical protein
MASQPWGCDNQFSPSASERRHAARAVTLDGFQMSPLPRLVSGFILFVPHPTACAMGEMVAPGSPAVGISS